MCHNRNSLLSTCPSHDLGLGLRHRVLVLILDFVSDVESRAWTLSLDLGLGLGHRVLVLLSDVESFVGLGLGLGHRVLVLLLDVESFLYLGLGLRCTVLVLVLFCPWSCSLM